MLSRKLSGAFISQLKKMRASSEALSIARVLYLSIQPPFVFAPVHPLSVITFYLSYVNIPTIAYYHLPLCIMDSKISGPRHSAQAHSHACHSSSASRLSSPFHYRMVM